MDTIEGGWALIGEQPREGRVWQEGVPKADRPRKTSESGSPLTEVGAMMSLPMLGWTDVTIQAPDSQAAAMAPGALVTFGRAQVALRGGDYGSIRTTVTVETLSPAGDGVAVLEQAAQSGSRKAAAS